MTIGEDSFVANRIAVGECALTCVAAGFVIAGGGINRVTVSIRFIVVVFIDSCGGVVFCVWSYYVLVCVHCLGVVDISLM